jgi:transcriptional regulator with XRE-family HTH domain
MPRKPLLTLDQVQAMRALEQEGWTRAALAGRFGCSRTTVANYLNGDLTVPASRGARKAIDEFVCGLGELDGERRALAAVARVLADRVDGARATGSAAVAARVLADLIERLAADVRRDRSEERARRALKAIELS